MQPDEWKQAWAAHGAALERSVAIDERILRELLLGKVRVALAPYVIGRALEVLLGVAVLLVVMPVLAEHAAEPRYLVVGGAVAVVALGITVSCAHLLVSSVRIDYGDAVTAIQRAVERLRLAEYRATKWALLGGVVVWLPAALLFFEAVTGLEPLAHVDLGFLAVNLVFGLAALALGFLLSRRYVDRPDLGPRARRLVDALTGRGLRSATQHLAELSSFERGDS